MTRVGGGAAGRGVNGLILTVGTSKDEDGRLHPG